MFARGERQRTNAIGVRGDTATVAGSPKCFKNDRRVRPHAIADQWFGHLMRRLAVTDGRARSTRRAAGVGIFGREERLCTGKGFLQFFRSNDKKKKYVYICDVYVAPEA